MSKKKKTIKNPDPYPFDRIFKTYLNDIGFRIICGDFDEDFDENFTFRGWCPHQSTTYDKQCIFRGCA